MKTVVADIKIEFDAQKWSIGIPFLSEFKPVRASENKKPAVQRVAWSVSQRPSARHLGRGLDINFVIITQALSNRHFGYGY